MRPSRPALLLAALSVALTLGACAAAGEGEPVTSYVTQTITRGSEEDLERTGGSTAEPAGATSITEVAREAYVQVLDKPGQYSFTGSGEQDFTGEYLYALADFTGDRKSVV